MALDEKGFMRPTYDEILQERIDQAKKLFGEDIDTSEASVLGKFIRLAVYDLAKAWESLEICYYARFPNTASGTNLDRLCPFVGITRNPATSAEHKVRFTGSADFTVPVGFLVGTEDGVQFYLVNEVTLDESGVGEGYVDCVDPGTVGNVTLGSITEIINPDASVFTVQGIDIVQLGEDAESDTDLRSRFVLASSGAGSATAAAIRAEVLRVTGVSSCTVVENTEDAADDAGRPPHSFECFVQAPYSADDDIAQAIFDKKPLGIKSYGSTTVAVTASGGETVNVSFSHTEDLPIYIKVAIRKDSRFDANDGVNQIKTALIEHINDLDIGVDVVYSALFGVIHGVNGVKDTVSLTLSANGTTYTPSNITISNAQKAVLSAQNITVEVSDYADT